LKNTHLLHYRHPSSLQRSYKYASLLRISNDWHLDIFEQPHLGGFFNGLLTFCLQFWVRMPIHYSLHYIVKGKPSERQGRKASDLSSHSEGMVAGLQ